MDTKAFYDKMRSGGIAKTAAINPDGFIGRFEEYLKDGVDILYLGFSSGLSTTYNSGVLAANALSEKYPDRKILCVDTLCASAGQGLLLKMAIDKKESGATIEETRDYIESKKLNLCHWFTVDDLVYLKRGGRVSAATAFVGNMLGIKPVMHVDNAGHLVNVSKVRGRKTAILEMAKKYGELHLEDDVDYVYISHGDCLADAEFLAKTIEEKYGKKTQIITFVGPVIGAHSGPGTLALFFLGKER
jgi:DegV family protein with EDD domain